MRCGSWHGCWKGRSSSLGSECLWLHLTAQPAIADATRCRWVGGLRCAGCASIDRLFGGKVAAMKLTRSDRSLIAWTLYFCVLFNVFACGLAHGQTMGLALNGVGGQFCSSVGSPAPASKADPADLSASGWAGSFACPICSAVTLSIALLFCLSWMLRIGQVRRPDREQRCKAPPRYSWPSANPRASPALCA